MGGQLPAQALPGLADLLPTLLSANTFPCCSQLMGDGWSLWEMMEVYGLPGRTPFLFQSPWAIQAGAPGPLSGSLPCSPSAFSRAKPTFLPAQPGEAQSLDSGGMGCGGAVPELRVNSSTRGASASC